MNRFVRAIVMLLCFEGLLTIASAEEEASAKIALSDGNIQLTAPGKWTRKKPRNRIIEHEFAAPASGDDAVDARITLMGAGGGVDRNIERWVGQFRQENGEGTPANRTKKESGGAIIHQVDLTGTYKDQRGPFAPATWRKDYRMLGAIIVTEKYGTYYAKLYGPKATVSENVKAFQQLIDSVRVKAADEQSNE